MTTGIETGAGSAWQVKQTTAGTIEPSTSAAMKRLRKAGDDGLKASKTSAQEEYVDGQIWSNASSYTDSVGGDVGSFAIQGQLAITAFVWAQLLGSDVVTGSSDPWTHTISSGAVVPISQTVYTKTGAAVGPIRQAWYDAKLSKLTHNNGADQKLLELTESFMALHAAETFATDPTATDSGEDPLRWEEAVTKINGTTFPEIKGDTVEADAKLGTITGQATRPIAFEFGKGTITRTLQTFITDGTLPQLYKVLYGSEAPAGASAISSTVQTAEIEAVYTRSASRRLNIKTPVVEIEPGDWVFGPKAAGGSREVAFGGRCHSTGSPLITVTAVTGDSTSYVA